MGFIAPVFHSISFFIFFKTEKPVEDDVLKFSYDITNLISLTDKKVILPSIASESDKILLSEVKRFSDTDFFINSAADNFKTSALDGAIKLLIKLME